VLSVASCPQCSPTAQDACSGISGVTGLLLNGTASNTTPAVMNATGVCLNEIITAQNSGTWPGSTSGCKRDIVSVDSDYFIEIQP
jgi:hypothetical protein